MPAERTIPVAAEQREFVVKVNGELLSRQQHLLAVMISHSANKLSRARLVYQDGAAASSDFPLSNSDSFVPGNEVEILAGAGGEEQSVFIGVVVKHGLKIRENVAPQLVIDCRHKAVKMTASRKSKYFSEQTDSDAISSIVNEHGVAGEIESSETEQEQLVQYNVSDWDFCLLRAAVNGHLLLSDGDKISTKKPDPTAAEKVVLQFGSSILELDVEVDARHQPNGISAFLWDPVNQEVVEKQATDPSIDAPGNLSAGELAAAIDESPKVMSLEVSNDGESQTSIDALWSVSQLNQIGARIKCEGMTEVMPNDVVQLDGIGERFSGKAYVSAVRHDFDLVKGWKTTLQIGGIRQLYEQTLADIGQGSTAHISPVSGLSSGVVVSNEDPNGEFRVKLALPMVGLGEEGVWARVATIDAGDARGMFFRPEVGDEVVVGFFNDDPRAPVVVGMLHSSAKPAPLEPSDDNHEKGYVSRSEMKMLFDDDQKIMRFETPGGNSIVLDEAEGAITLTDQNGNIIAMTSSGIKIESAGEIELVAATDLKAKSEMETKFEAGTELKLEGSAGSALSSSAVTEVKGSLVQIN